MTPNEKAQDIWVKYYERLPDSIYSNYAAKMEAKYFALIAVDEILSFIEDDRESFSWKKYYQEVKQEIEKL